MIDICLPVKDEEQILASNLARLLDYLGSVRLADDWRVVVLVNGSQDASGQIAGGLAAENFRVKVVETAAGGKGRALKSYFISSQAETLVFMDIDLAVSLTGLPALLEPIYFESADLVIGSRLLERSTTDRSFWRSLTSRAYNALSRFVLRHRYSDLQCGFKAVRRSAFNQVVPYLKDDAWFFDTELVVASSYAGFKVREIPVDWRENRYDQRRSKVRVWRDAWSFAVNLLRLHKRLNSDFCK